MIDTGRCYSLPEATPHDLEQLESEDKVRRNTDTASPTSTTPKKEVEEEEEETHKKRERSEPDTVQGEEKIKTPDDGRKRKQKKHKK